MTKLETRKILEQMLEIYPQFKLTEQKIELWCLCLEDIAFDKARNNLIEHAKTSKYIPTIAEVRGTVKPNKILRGDICEVTQAAFEIFEPPLKH